MKCLYTMVFLVCFNTCVPAKKEVEIGQENDIKDIFKTILNLPTNESFNDYPPRSLLTFRRHSKQKECLEKNKTFSKSSPDIYDLALEFKDCDNAFKPPLEKIEGTIDDSFECMVNAKKKKSSKDRQMQERQKRLKYVNVEDDGQDICKRRRNKLGKKLALKPLLRKSRFHKRRYGKRICKYKPQNKTCSIGYKSLDGNNFLNSLDSEEDKDRVKRFNNFGVSFNINVPKHKHPLNDLNSFCIEKFNIPHEVSVNRENTAWSVKVKNFKNMEIKLGNDNDIHFETCYSNLRNASNLLEKLKQMKIHKNYTSCSTTPQYSINFKYDTNEKQTQVKISSLEKPKFKKKDPPKCTLKPDSRASVEIYEITTYKPVIKEKTTTVKIKQNMHEIKHSALPKCQMNVVKEDKAKDFEKKYGSYSLISCLGIHGDSDCFNHLKPLKQIAL